MFEAITSGESDTFKLGRSFAGILKAGDSVSLTGELGSGKTVFVRGAAAGLGYNGIVTSPTFTLVHEYMTEIPIYHIDCFRLRNPKDVLSVGLEDYLAKDSITLVEWADLIEGYFNKWSFEIRFSFAQCSENQRQIRFIAGKSENVIPRLGEFKNLVADFSEIRP